jgi:hypothetical protein
MNLAMLFLPGERFVFPLYEPIIEESLTGYLNSQLVMSLEVNHSVKVRKQQYRVLPHLNSQCFEP